MLRYAIRLSVSVATFLLGVALSAAPALLPSDAPRGSAFEKEVLDANREYLEAHKSRDVGALDRLLADEFTVGGRFGRFTSKDQRLAMVADTDFEFLSIDSRYTRVTASEHAGEVTGQAVMRVRHMGREYDSPLYHYARRFEKREGRWQLIGVRVFRDG